MSEIVSYINDIEDKIVTKGASDTEIWYAQAALSLKFSDEYIDVLKNYGCLLIKGETFFGISNKKAYDVVSQTKEEKAINPNIPSNMYVVSSLGVEGLLILQDASGEIYESSYARAPKLIHNSLLEYLKEL